VCRVSCGNVDVVGPCAGRRHKADLVATQSVG
jgi:hypothetical protein